MAAIDLGGERVTDSETELRGARGRGRETTMEYLALLVPAMALAGLPLIERLERWALSASPGDGMEGTLSVTDQAEDEPRI